MGHPSTETDRSPFPEQPSLRADTLVDRFVGLTQARPSDHITIACRGHADLSLDLCHRGFTHVDWMCAEQAGIHETTDILWLPFVGDHRHLELALDRFARWVRPGGIAVVHDVPASGSVTQHTFQLRQILRHHGFTAMVQEPDPACGFLLTARRVVMPDASQLQHLQPRGMA